MRHRSALLLGTLVAATAAPARAGLDYVSETVAPIGTGRSVVGRDLNNAGVAVGVATSNPQDPLEFQPWIWSARDGVRSLVKAQGPSAFVWAGPINDAGTVAGGYYVTPEGGAAGLPVPFGALPHALFWATDGSGGFTPIPGLGGILGLVELGNAVEGINGPGAVVGVSLEAGESPFGDPRAFLLDERGVLHDLSALGGPGATLTRATGINDAGAICGEALVNGRTRAFFHSPDGRTVLLPPAAANQAFMTAAAVNGKGEVIGWAQLDGPAAPVVGYVWRADEGLTGLGPFLPLDINGRGDIVAVGPAPPREGAHAYVRIEGAWTDLNDVVATTPISWLSRPVAVNDGGQILVVEQFDPSRSILINHLTRVLTPAAPSADLNGDGAVSTADLLALLAAWGPCPRPPAACSADLDADGAVGTADLLLLLSQWG